LPEFFRDHGISAADIITPNVYEAAWLTGMTIESLDTARVAAQALRAMGPGLVVITGILCGAELATLALCGELAWVVMTPKLDLASYGAGDAFTALFLGCYLASRSARDALSRAASGLHAILQTSLDAKIDGDLRLIQALDAAVAPRKLYAAQQL
jgi:pyridoxine kinase